MIPPARAAFLTRLAARYAMRHRGQTTRAIAGLLVATSVLFVGLGMGSSLGGSFERAAVANFGPVDVVVDAREPFDQRLAGAVLIDPKVRAQRVDGAATMRVTGSALNPEKELAEAFASVRGVSPDEARALGPLRGPGGEVVPEPGPGEVVLSQTLAERLDARPGDRVVFQVPIPGTFPDPDLEVENLSGVAGAPAGLSTRHEVRVGEDALGMLVLVQWGEASGAISVQARSPGGVVFGNSSATSPARLLLEPPLEPGTWIVTVSAGVPTPYTGAAGLAYPPPSLASGRVPVEARVSAIAAPEGRAAVTFRPVALVPLEDLEAATGLRGKATHMYLSVGGDPETAVAAIQEALPRGREWDVEAVKRESLEEAGEAAREISGFLLVMGGFTLVSAVLLAFALFSALVEERRPELGIARALGLTRGEVAFSMTVEGALYAAGAAVAGLLLGFAILASFVAGIDWFSQANDGPEIGLHLGWDTVLVAFLVGTLLPLATIALASLRFARLDPARAIRGIPEDARGGRRWRVALGLVVAGVGLLLSLGAIGRLVGVPIALAGGALALASTGRRWPAAALVAGAFAHVAWSLYAFDAWPERAEELDPVLTLARGAVLALVGAAVVVASPKPYDWVGRLLARRRSPRASFVALRYLVSRRVATGLTTAMIALVVVVVTVMGTLFLLFDATIPEDAAGYQVLGESPLSMDGLPALPADLESSVERVDVVLRHFEFRPANLTRAGDAVGDPWALTAFLGVGEGFAENAEFPLAARADAYADDRAVWRAVAAGEALVLPWWSTDDPDEPKVGDRVTLETALGRPRDYVVAGTVRTTYFSGTFAAFDHVRAMGFPTGSLLFVRTAEGADPDVVAHRLTAELAEEGVTFLSIPEEAARIASTTRAFLLVFESFLALGLFVGLAATGFMASRAVRERMRDIGTLRAVGFEEADVRRAFVAESTLTAGLGLALGTAVGLLVAHSVWWREIRGNGIPFLPPFAMLAFVGACVLLLAALASAGPARRASRLAPAVAVRHTE